MIARRKNSDVDCFHYTGSIYSIVKWVSQFEDTNDFEFSKDSLDNNTILITSKEKLVFKINYMDYALRDQKGDYTSISDYGFNKLYDIL